MDIIDSICLSCRTCMGDMPYLIKPGKNAYSAETYVGNWYEDTCRNTVKRDEFLKKRECGDLKIQRTQTMIDLLLKPVPLSQKMDGYVHFGDVVQIVSPGPTCNTAIQEHPFKRGHCRMGHLVLSSSVPPSVIDHAPYLSTESIISASPHLFPVVRNSFVIENPACPLDTGVLNYGDVFRIRAMPTQHFKLYLFSSPGIRLHVASTHSAKPRVRFSDVASSDTLWSAWPMDEFEKLKVDLGVPVPLKTRLYIKHNGTGINLSTEPQFPVLTYFGDELEVTTDTKKDRVRRPTYANIWYFDTDRGRRYPEPDECMKQFMEQSKKDAEINVNMVHKSAAEEEKQKEEAQKEAEDQGEGDDDEYDQSYMVQQQVNQFDPREFRETLRIMDAPRDRTAGGQIPYDPRTAPQPNAYTYRVFKDYPYFPNRKFSCGNTDCCYLRPPPPPMEEGECCDCVEYPEREPNPNVRVESLKPLIR